LVILLNAITWSKRQPSVGAMAGTEVEAVQPRS
jgi:hypothetical protein